MPRTVLIGLAVLALAAGCTAGKQPSHPARTSLAATAPATSTPSIPIAALRRPLRLPRLDRGQRCPRTHRRQVQAAFAQVLGDGPAYPTDSADSWRDGRVEGGWYYAKVLWVASPAHPGPFLVRGGSWTGRGSCASARDPTPTRAAPTGGTARSPDSGWFNWPSSLRLRGGGCYAYQVDAASGSRVIVFRA